MTVTCAKCGRVLERGADRCPDCGSGDKAKTLTARVEASGSVRLRHRDTSGFRLLERTIRRKRSRHGRPARETLEYDHSAPDKTIKTHIVYEKVDGKWKLCHDERVISPAKHRPPHRLQPEPKRNPDADSEDKCKCPR